MPLTIAIKASCDSLLSMRERYGSARISINRRIACRDCHSGTGDRLSEKGSTSRFLAVAVRKNQLMNGLQLFPQSGQQVQPKGIRAIGESALGGFMDFEEHSIHAGGDGGARERGDELGFAARGVAQSARNLDAVRGVENHGPAGFAHDRKAAHVHYKVVVAE